MSIESVRDLHGLARVGQVVATTLRELEAQVRPGVTTGELDALAGTLLKRAGARSAPRLYYGFPGVTCISVNDEAVHGIPGERVLQPGDLVKIDLTAELDGYVGDAAITVPIAPVSPRRRQLARCAEAAFRKALQAARAGRPINAIGRAIETEVTRQGFKVLRLLCSHGVGRQIHEEPTIPNYDEPRVRGRLTDGLVITIEPIIAETTAEVETAADGWTEKTADGSFAAHVEHTIVVTRDQPIILTGRLDGRPGVAGTPSVGDGSAAS